MTVVNFSTQRKIQTIIEWKEGSRVKFKHPAGGKDSLLSLKNTIYGVNWFTWMGEVFSDNIILDTVEGLTEEYLRIKYTAEADNDKTVGRAVITMHNIDANRDMGSGPSRKEMGRESAMIDTFTFSAIVTCSHCKRPRHRFQNCFELIGTMSGKQPPPLPRQNSPCSLHNIYGYDCSDCRSQKRDDNITGRLRPGQQKGRHITNRSAHSNTVTTPTSTTQMEYFPSQ